MRIRLIVMTAVLSTALIGTGARAAVIDSFLPDMRQQSNSNDSTQRYAQSFVAGIDANVGSIGLIVEYAGSDARVDIYAVDPGGDTPTGVSLAHGIITSGIGTVPDGDAFDGPALDDMSYFDLTTPFPVLSGEKFAIALSSDANLYLNTQGNPGTDLSYTDDDGLTWTAFGGGVAAPYIVLSTVPEPTSLSLLVLGGFGLLKRSRRRM